MFSRNLQRDSILFQSALISNAIWQLHTHASKRTKVEAAREIMSQERNVLLSTVAIHRFLNSSPIMLDRRKRLKKVIYIRARTQKLVDASAIIGHVVESKHQTTTISSIFFHTDGIDASVRANGVEENSLSAR